MRILLLSSLFFFPIFFCAINQINSQSIDISGPVGSGGFGSSIKVLTNGNYVITDPSYDEGATPNVGAVYLYNGKTHSLISTLKGSTANDRVGNGLIIALSNGNFVVRSLYWNNGGITNAGAATWCNGITGLSGEVNSLNSLVGSSIDENLGIEGILPLPNGNYIVCDRFWDNGAITDAGAVTWCNGEVGRTGIVNSTNSLVGTNSSDGIGSSAIVLTNSNYVVQWPNWNGGFGAVTWCSGETGRTGFINISNSLVGNSADHLVGNIVTALSNGNYVVCSYNWDNGAITDVGAVTWCNGTTGTTGTVSASNSLIGNTAYDYVGWHGIVPLSNGNYLTSSPLWHNGIAANAGAVTWCNGTIVTTGVVTASNSLVGSNVDDNIGNLSIGRVTTLDNGNYVVASPNWDNGSIADVGAVTWGNGTGGVAGVINIGNSLIGSSINDNIGSRDISALTNGNYVIASPNWDNGSITDAGAATLCNGTTGTVGFVNNSNSLTGSTSGDNVGSAGVAALTNGNYVVASPNWNNGLLPKVGAATWCSGITGTTGFVSSSNSLIGVNPNDQVASSTFLSSTGKGVTALSNGNYVVQSYYWDNGNIIDAGAVTWGNGLTGHVGLVSANNSLVGNSTNDNVGLHVSALINGDYIVGSQSWDNGVIVDAGAVTLGNGITGLNGIISNCNSVLGSSANGGVYIVANYNYVEKYLIAGHRIENTVTIFNPKGMLIAVTMDEQSININGGGEVPIITDDCRIIATIAATGTNPVNGTINAKTWIETSIPVYGGEPFVSRHYEITPVSNASSVTGRLTLYFSQQEFTDFNNHPGSDLNLPADSSDAAGISNLRIGKFGGTSNTGTGMPDSYSGLNETINPLDQDIVWNSIFSRWEVSFDVAGFSGFIVRTEMSVLPLTFLEFSADLVGNNSLLKWKTTDEINTISFEIERSSDGIRFSKIGNVAAANTSGVHTYNFTDYHITSLGKSAIYYRIKQKDINQNYSYSKIIRLQIVNSGNSIIVYPNPAATQINLETTVDKPQLLHLNIINIDGKLIQRQQFSLTNGNNFLVIKINNLKNGIYFLDFKGKTIQTRKKIIKK